ncbi:MAG: putative immunity protein [Methanoregula sp.]
MKPEPRKKRREFSITHKDEPMAALVNETDKKTLAIWAVDCAERVLHFFEEDYPDDPRPRNALEACRAWITPGVFRMADIRKAALAAHAAAREAGKDTAARSAARAAGQAVATAHVPAHSLGAARYALQAVFRSTDPPDADAAIAVERDWQYRQLLELKGRFPEK